MTLPKKVSDFFYVNSVTVKYAENLHIWKFSSHLVATGNAKVWLQNERFYKTFTYPVLSFLLNHSNTQVFCVLKIFFEFFYDSIIAEIEKEC